MDLIQLIKIWWRKRASINHAIASIGTGLPAVHCRAITIINIELLSNGPVGTM